MSVISGRHASSYPRRLKLRMICSHMWLGAATFHHFGSAVRVGLPNCRFPHLFSEIIEIRVAKHKNVRVIKKLSPWLVKINDLDIERK